MSTCLIALGSAQGDDALAWMVADALGNESGHDAAALRIHKTDRIGPEWLTYWQDCARVILVDALRHNAPIGTVYCHRLLPDPEIAIDGLKNSLSSHGLSLPGLLDLAAALEQLPPELVLFGIEVSACVAGQDLSEPVRSALPLLQQRVSRYLRAIPPRAQTAKEPVPI